MIITTRNQRAVSAEDTQAAKPKIPKSSHAENVSGLINE
jgi:hypothetical protein